MSKPPPIPRELSGLAVHIHERQRRDSEPPSLFSRIPTVWKVLVVIGAILAAGAGGYAYLTRFVTRDEIPNYENAIDALREEIQAMRVGSAMRQADIAAIKKSNDDMREDLGLLLKYVLENPSRKR
jgi:hypothetical protein